MPPARRQPKPQASAAKPKKMGKKNASIAQSIPPEISNDPAVTVIVLDSEGSSTPVASPKDIPVTNDSSPLAHMSLDANDTNNSVSEPADPEPTQLETNILHSSHEISSSYEDEVAHLAQERAPSSSKLSNWLTPATQADEGFIDLVIHDLCDSKHCLWMGDPVMDTNIFT